MRDWSRAQISWPSLGTTRARIRCLSSCTRSAGCETASLVPAWRSRSAYLREVACEREEIAPRTFVSGKPYVLRAARRTEHLVRGRPHSEQASGPLEACIEAALLRSTRVVVADLVEQVLEAPPSLEELAAP